jgi:hypothetical protein
MTNYINIFFLSKGPSYIDVGVLNEKISQVNVTTKNLIFKLHLLLNTICCTRPLNPSNFQKSNIYPKFIRVSDIKVL